MKSAMKKFYVTLGMLIILTIPLMFMNSVVKNRESYKQEAVNEITKSWAAPQTISAPKFVVKKTGGKDIKSNFILKDYNVNVDVKTEIRKRGIFKVPVYTADVILKGNLKNTVGDFKNAYGTFSINVSDTKGFVNQPEVKIANMKAEKFNSTDKTLKFTSEKGSLMPFEIHYKLRGLNSIKVETLGDDNNVNIKSNWTSPSFTGDFLPVTREITKEGFNAQWSVPKLAASSITNPSCEVSLLVPVDNYRMVTRAVKYAFLFLSLIFMAFYLFEITSKKGIAPIQYLMIGSAMLIFYLLLTSTSEFVPFFAAYLISALMTVGLIGMYTYFVLTKKQNIKFSILITSALTILYIYLYTILKLEDFALITGSIGLFIAVAVSMYVTRNIDWDENNNS